MHTVCILYAYYDVHTVYLNDMNGQVFVFFILTVAAAESAIGLAILVLLFRNKSTIALESNRRS